MDPRLVVVRDQFALRRLSDDALKQIAPALEQMRQVILAELEAVGDGQLTWFLTRRLQMLATIDTQLAAVADRLERVLEPALVEAYKQGAANARIYLDGVTPPDVTPTPITPGLAAPGTFTITEQQLAAVAQGRGFGGFPGLGYDLQDVVTRWKGAQLTVVQRQLETGFLLSQSTGEIVANIRDKLESSTRASVEAVVRTSMATASQAAHDAFYEANADALGDADGNRYRWDASNDGRTCSVCAPLDDSRYKTREAVPKHPAHFNCRCVVLPITPISDMLDPGQGSFLESVPARDADGKRIPAPAGYDGDNAYKRPRKINGEWRWVRRRDDMDPGRSTAGDMLLRANDMTKHDVLGTWDNVDAFKLLTKPGGQFHGDPQGAVIELLRPGGQLPAGASRRLPRTPARR